MNNVETRKLVAHEKLLIDVIKRQAGSLKKAILEGTMNSVEAGATEMAVVITTIEDISATNEIAYSMADAVPSLFFSNPRLFILLYSSFFI